LQKGKKITKKIVQFLKIGVLNYLFWAFIFCWCMVFGLIKKGLEMENMRSNIKDCSRIAQPDTKNQCLIDNQEIYKLLEEK